MTPSPQADDRTLIRRAYIDLIGLKPTFEEVEAYASDASPNKYEKLVDTLLAQNRKQLIEVVTTMTPGLMDLPGLGPVTAAQVRASVKRTRASSVGVEPLVSRMRCAATTA